jgi:SAF domain
MTWLGTDPRPPSGGGVDAAAPPAAAPPAAAPAAGPPTVRNPRFVLAGVLLVLAGAVLFYATSVRVDPRMPVLVVAGPVPVGHVLTDGDLLVVRIVPDPLLGAVPDTQRASVVGRAVRQPLAAHTLLQAGMLGPARWPPAGQSVLAVAVKPGHCPSGVVAGAAVLVLVVPAESAGIPSALNTPSGVVQAKGVVVSVSTPDGTGDTVVSLLVSSATAVRIVGAAGDVSLVEQGG